MGKWHVLCQFVTSTAVETTHLVEVPAIWKAAWLLSADMYCLPYSTTFQGAKLLGTPLKFVSCPKGSQFALQKEQDWQNPPLKICLRKS